MTSNKRSAWCKECARAYYKAWREANPEREAAKKARYVARHPESIRQYYRRNKQRMDARSRKWALEHRDKAREYTRRSYQKHLQKRRKYTQRYNAANRHKRKEYRDANVGRVQDYHRRYHLKTTFGISSEQYEAIATAQGNACAICGAPPPTKAARGGGPGRLAIDHDHVSGAVRGLLCLLCNSALARMESVEGWHERALRYLDANSSKVRRSA